MALGLEQERIWQPLGITHPLATIHVDTVINTWIALGALLLLIIIGRLLLRTNTLGSTFVKSIIKSFMDLIEQTAGSFIHRYYYFIATLFSFILICNWIAILPGVEEPTKDINTTLAFGICALVYTQKEIIHAHGILAYLKEYLAPFNIIFPLNFIVGLGMLPIKLLGEIALVFSLAFRLFGNIFGGAIIMGIFQQGVSNSILWQSIGMLSGISLLITGFFLIFEGFLQAFVFSILTLTNITMAIAVEEEDV